MAAPRSPWSPFVGTDDVGGTADLLKLMQAMPVWDTVQATDRARRAGGSDLAEPKLTRCSARRPCPKGTQPPSSRSCHRSPPGWCRRGRRAGRSPGSWAAGCPQADRRARRRPDHVVKFPGGHHLSAARAGPQVLVDEHLRGVVQAGPELLGRICAVGRGIGQAGVDAEEPSVLGRGQVLHQAEQAQPERVIGRRSCSSSNPSSLRNSVARWKSGCWFNASRSPARRSTSTRFCEGVELTRQT